MQWQTLDLTLNGLQNHYAKADFTPQELVSHLLNRCQEFTSKNLWIELFTLDKLQHLLDDLEQKSNAAQASLPLYGVPFAVKDNIDIAEIPTTAGCPEFAYVAKENASVIQHLIQAGAIPIGKTNMDQFATGLVGTRSPYGICKNAFDDNVISGGSSSGSAVAVSLGLASFSLGTDTAGSGRVPAALNNIIGFKPSKGLISTLGVVPACRSLDVVSIFALTAGDARSVFSVCAKQDFNDPYSRKNPYENSDRVAGTETLKRSKVTIGVPRRDQLDFFGDSEFEALFHQVVQQWQTLGAQIKEIDFSAFIHAANLLYQGPWVAERYLASQSVITNTPDAMHPVVRKIIEPAIDYKATEAFNALYQLQIYKQQADEQFAHMDFILTPTTGTYFNIQDVLENPIQLNSQLGYYTNFMNLLDYSGISVPCGFSAGGLPFGATLVGRAFEDQRLLAWAEVWQNHLSIPLGNTQKPYKKTALSQHQNLNTIEIVVCGAHLTGEALNWQLTERDAHFVEATHTSDHYRLFALSDGIRPGLRREKYPASRIAVEVWRLPAAQFGSFVQCIPSPLGIGKIELADGRWLSGFVCEPFGFTGAQDITHYGGWKTYLEAKKIDHSHQE